MAKVVDKRKQKEKREKIFLGVAAGLLLLLLVIQLPKMMKSKGSASAAQTTSATTSGVLTDTTAVTTGAGPSGSSNVVVAPGEDFAPGPGQLASMQLFANNDPFSQNTTSTSASPTTTTTSRTTTTTTKKPSGSTRPGKTTTTAPTTTAAAPIFLSAVIAVNGVPEGVNVAATFPAASPVFELKSALSSSVQVGIYGGQFSDGTPTLTINKGQSVTLVNTADGTRYVLQLISVSTKAAEMPTTTGATTAAGPSPPVPPTTITATTSTGTTGTTTTG